MIRIIAAGMLIPSIVNAQTINSVQIKQNEQATIQPGWMCYDEPSQKKIDKALESGVECLVELKKANKEITALRREQVAVENFKAVEYNPPEFYQHPLVIAGTAMLFGLGFGVAIGLAF